MHDPTKDIVLFRIGIGLLAYFVLFLLVSLASFTFAVVITLFLTAFLAIVAAGYWVSFHVGNIHSMIEVSGRVVEEFKYSANGGATWSLRDLLRNRSGWNYLAGYKNSWAFYGMRPVYLAVAKRYGITEETIAPFKCNDK